MRCQNCGWDNQPNASVCTKCGQVLPVNTAPATPVVEKQSPQQPQPSAQTDRATMVFKHGQMPQMAQPQTVVAAQVTQCGNCGYPVTGGDTICPACGAQLATPKPQPTPQPVQQAAPQPTPAPAPKPAHVEQATVRFRPGEVPTMPQPSPVADVRETIVSAPQPKATLAPMPEENAPAMPKLVNDGGRWFIEPSGNGPIYVQVLRRTELQAGDIVMVGTKKFRLEM